MFAVQTPFPRPALPLYAAGFDAFETALSVWTASFRTAADIGATWTSVWLKTPTAFAAWRPDELPEPGPALESAAETVQRVEIAAVDVAEAVVEAMEEIAEIPLTVAEETAAVVEAEMEPELDDLTRLVGIGPKLAAALAERGITRYEHIAAWTEGDLSEIDKALDLKGRAVRDAWVAQAKRFLGAETPVAAPAERLTTH